MQLAKCTNLMHASARTDACVRLDIPHIPLTMGGAGLNAQWAKGVLWMELGGAGLSTQVGQNPLFASGRRLTTPALPQRCRYVDVCLI